MTTHYEPIACSLPADDAIDQALELGDLRVMAVATEPLDNGVALTFETTLADRVADFAAREAQCCGFLSLTTSRSDEFVRLEVTSKNPDAHRIIDVMFGVGGR